MTIRTDLKYENGKLSATNQGTSDSRHKLPQVKLSDHLASDKWGPAIQAEAGTSDTALDIAASTHKTLVQKLHGLVEQRNTQDPTMTQGEHLRRVKRTYDGLVQTATERSDHARRQLRQRKSDLKRDFESSLKFDERDASEIRGMIRNMPQEKQSEFLNQAIENGDGNVLAAVFRGHPSLSGLDAKRSEAYYRRAMQKHAPEGAKLYSALDKADDMLLRSFSDLLTADDSVTASGVRDIIEREADKAQKAAQKAQTGTWGA